MLVRQRRLLVCFGTLRSCRSRRNINPYALMWNENSSELSRSLVCRVADKAKSGRDCATSWRRNSPAPGRYGVSCRRSTIWPTTLTLWSAKRGTNTAWSRTSSRTATGWAWKVSPRRYGRNPYLCRDDSLWFLSFGKKKEFKTRLNRDENRNPPP